MIAVSKNVMKSLAVAVLGLGFLCPAVSAAAQGNLEDRINRVIRDVRPDTGEHSGDRTLNGRMARERVPGVSIAVIDNCRLDWARGFGWADAAKKTPVTEETLFQAASISQPLSALLALKLVEEGRLTLDDDVQNKLSSWRLRDPKGVTAGEKVTLRRLLNHTAGTNVHAFRGYGARELLPSDVQILDGRGKTSAVEVAHEPGSFSRYSAGGFLVLQRLLSDATGQSFHGLMAEKLLEPLAMENSTFQQPLPVQRHPQAAAGFRSDGKALANGWLNYPESAATGLWSTPTDLAKFVLALQRAHAAKSGGIIQQQTARAMMSPGKGNFGLGLTLVEGGTSFWQNGANEGYRAELRASLQAGRGVVVMTNSDNATLLIRDIITSVARAYGWTGNVPQRSDCAS